MADLWSLVRPIVIDRYDRDLSRRRWPQWRDVLLAAVVVYAVLLGIAVLVHVNRVAGPSGPWMWTDPDTQVTYRCSTADPREPYTCVPER